MKNIFFLSVLLISGVVNAKEIPSPFWFSISEKILAETQSLFNTDVKEVSKPVAKKKQQAVVKVKQLSCEQDEHSISLPFPTFKRGSGIWMITE